MEILIHPLLAGTRHGFFTRKGGASSGVYAGLNCGRASADQLDAVALNRSRAALALDVAPDRLVSLHQVHSSTVVTVTEADDLAALRSREADALVTARPDIALAVLTADCLPVLLVDRQAGIVGAAHAGWKGTLAGVLEATVAAMRTLGASDISAVVGPAISQRAYEVGDELMDQFLADDPDNDRFFATGPNGRPMFDLPGLGVARLRAAGVDAEWLRHCTYSDRDLFFSFRRATHLAEPDYGRLISAIALG